MVASTEMIFEQRVAGQTARVIVLRGRSLPFRPLELGEESRVKTTFYAGNPVATQQRTGPRYKPTTFRGQWSTKFLVRDDNAPSLIGFPALANPAQQTGVLGGSAFASAGAFPSEQRVRQAAVLWEAFRLMLRESQTVRWSWAGLRRYGTLTELDVQIGEPTGGLDDIAWSSSAAWSGEDEFSPVAASVTYNALSTAEGLLGITRQVAEALQRLGLLRRPNGFVGPITRQVSELVDLTAVVINALRGVVNVTAVPSDLAGTIRGSLEDIRRIVQELYAELRAIPSARSEAAKIGKAEDMNTAALVQKLLRKRLVELAAFAAEQQRLLALFEQRDVQSTTFARSSQSLRDIAAKPAPAGYGDPRLWRAIADYNGFTSQVVPRGTVILVPRLS